MFNRVRDSLVYPREIIKYRKDRTIFVLFYILFFAVLLSSKTIIDVVKFDGLSYAYKDQITENMAVLTQDCEISNAVLTCDSEEVISLYEEAIFTVYLDANSELDFAEYSSSNYGIIFHDESVYIYVFGLNTLTVPLADLPAQLQNIDFSEQQSNSEAFYDNLFEGVDELILSYKGLWGSLTIAIEILIGILFYLAFILISAWFLKKRYKVIPYKETFALTTYSSTSLFIILTFYSLLNLSLFVVVILLIISFRQNGILNSEIERRLKKKS